MPDDNSLVTTRNACRLRETAPYLGLLDYWNAATLLKIHKKKVLALLACLLGVLWTLGYFFFFFHPGYTALHRSGFDGDNLKMTTITTITIQLWIGIKR